MNADQIGDSLDADAVTQSGEVESYPEKDMAVSAVMRVAESSQRSSRVSAAFTMKTRRNLQRGRSR